MKVLKPNHQALTDHTTLYELATNLPKHKIDLPKHKIVMICHEHVLDRLRSNWWKWSIL